MSSVSPRRPKGKIMTGICTNKNYTNPKTDEVGPCPKCASQEKIKVEVNKISDFRCPECGEKLTIVKQSVSKWVWIGCGGAAAIASLIICLALPKGGNNQTLSTGDSLIDTTTVVEAQKDTVEVKESVVEQPTTPDSKVSEPKETAKAADKTTAPTSKSVLGGTAVMTTSGGYTTIKFKRSYQLEMGDANHSVLYINPNDEIYMANVRNGVLYGGQLKRKSGEEESIYGIRIKL